MTTLCIIAFIIMTVLVLVGLATFFFGVTTDVWWLLSLSFLLFAIALVIDIVFGDTIMAVIF